MSIIGKSTKSLRKHSVTGDNFTVPKTLLFAHKFSSASTSLDLTNLVVPSDTEFTGWQNPTSAEIAQAHISSIKANVYLQFVNKPARLIPVLSYQIASDSAINFINGISAAAGDIIIGWINTYAGNAVAVDGYSIVNTGIISAGNTTVTTSLPFNYNLNSGQQVGDVIFFLGGQQLFRCLNNTLTSDGEYIEVAPSSGALTNTLQLKTAPLVDTSYAIISNGKTTFSPTQSWINSLQTLGGQIDIMVADLAAVTGNPTSRYYGSPNQTDLSVFGNRVTSMISGSLYNAVVGSSAQVTAGTATGTSLVNALSTLPLNGRILILDDYAGGENITISQTCTIEGQGRGSVVTGTTTVSASYCTIKNIKFGNSLTISSGANGNFVRECFIASGKTVTDSGTMNSKLIIEEA